MALNSPDLKRRSWQLVMWVQHALPLNNEEENIWVTSGLSESDEVWIRFQAK